MSPGEAKAWVEVAGGAILVLSNLVAVLVAVVRILRIGDQTRDRIDASHDRALKNQEDILQTYSDELLAGLRSLASQQSRGSNGADTERWSEPAPEIAGPPLEPRPPSRPEES